MWGFYTRRPAGLTDGNTDAVKVLLHACVSVCVCVVIFQRPCRRPKTEKAPGTKPRLLAIPRSPKLGTLTLEVSGLFTDIWA